METYEEMKEIITDLKTELRETAAALETQIGGIQAEVRSMQANWSRDRADTWKMIEELSTHSATNRKMIGEHVNTFEGAHKL